MRRVSHPIVLTFLTVACGNAGSGSPAADAGRPDASPGDAGPDAATDAGRLPDAGVADLGQPDAAADAAVDAAVDAGPPLPDPIRINELSARNEGTWVDELGAVEDWIELYNASAEPVSLAGYALSDKANPIDVLGSTGTIDASLIVQPHETVILFADGAPGEGPRHLSFKLSGGGESVSLWNPAGTLVDAIAFPDMATNHSYAREPDARGDFVDCEWPTPSHPNGQTCGAPPPPDLPDDIVYSPYTWPEPWPQPPRPLVLSELSLRPAAGDAAFVEIVNGSDAAVPLAGWHLAVSPQAPGQPWPTANAPGQIALDGGQPNLGAGERLVVPLAPAALAALEATPAFEGVVTLWAPAQDYPADRMDFMEWPVGAALARPSDTFGHADFCAPATPGAANAACVELPERPIADRVRQLGTEGDFERLARGGTSVGIESVKFIVDMQGGDAVYFLDTEHWDLHYTFIREQIEHQPHLDRCDPAENRIFYDGWYRFSQVNYFQVQGRRYLLGTLVHYAGSGLYTVEFTTGDVVSSDQMRRAFFAVLARVDAPQRFAIRPSDANQYDRIQALDGRVPLIGQNAPFRGLTYQPLTQAVGYGTLTFVPLSALDTTPLGEQVIVVTDQVPNDIPFVGGLVTEAFQTPLAHVSLLSRARGTPDMALPDARNDPQLAPLFGKLVRLTVEAGGFHAEEADPQEALAFWEARRPHGEPLRPRLDTTVRGVVPLDGRGVEDLPSIGGKASQFAELYRVDSRRAACLGPLNIPPDAAAVPMVHGLEHFQTSGAAALLTQLRADPVFQSDPEARAAGLAQVQHLIVTAPVDPVLLAQVTDYVATHFGDNRARFRSSSNTEDLPGFNGAGLYTSVSGTTSDPNLPVDDALRTVWASLWNARGYDEREYNNVDHESVAMAVLIHPAYPTERANGVGISRNILDPLYPDHYINAQLGEASVTNPVPGVASEQMIFHAGNPGTIEYFGRSSLTGGANVLTFDEVSALSCRLGAIHDHFRPLLDPEGTNRWFAMDMEFKLLGDEHTLLFKQARQYSFGHADIPADCREF